MPDKFNSATELVEQLVPTLATSDSPSSNPYLAMRILLDRALIPQSPHPGGFREQLYAISGLFAVSILLGLLFGLVTRARRDRRGFWLFRVIQGPEPYFLPHGIISWTSALAAECVLVEAFIIFTIQQFNTPIVVSIVLWNTGVWGLAWITTWLATWNLGISHLLQIQGEGLPRLQWHSAWLINLRAGLSLALFLFTIIPINVYTFINLRAGYNHFNDVQDRLLNMSATWTTGQQLNLTTAFVPIEPTLGHCFSAWRLSTRGFRGVLLSYSLWTALLALALAIVGTARLRMIYRHLSASYRISKSPMISTQSSSILKLGVVRKQEYGQDENLKRAWRSLFSVVVLLSGSILGFSGVTLYEYLKGEFQATGFLLDLVLFYTLIAFGLPTSIILLQSAFRVTPSQASRHVPPGKKAPFSLQGRHSQKQSGAGVVVHVITTRSEQTEVPLALMEGVDKKEAKVETEIPLKCEAGRQAKGALRR
ncbi:hypothetical protein MNV49_000941 [Pseudohyphozyma bogoriensis]|nr:hypothetical protein MNV49_000941 [Pseudohyphozyma bogoriensis]